MDIDINRLKNGDGIEAILMRHQACWHKTCRLNFNQTKLNRLNKKVVQEENEISIQTHSNHNLKMPHVCFVPKLPVLRVFIMLPFVILTGKFINVHWNLITPLS